MSDLSSIARVEGPNLALRLIQPEDAAYIHSLRGSPSYNTHFSKVTGTLPDLLIEHDSASPNEQKDSIL